MICYVKNLPDTIWQTGCFWFDNDVYARIFATYMGPMKVRETNFKTLKCFDIMFFLFIRPSQMLGCYSVGSPLKLLNCGCSKVCLTCSMPLHPRGCIFFFFMRRAISARFPYGNPTRPWPGENTAWNQNPVTYIKWLASNSKERPNLWITGRQHWGICFHAVVSSILGDTIG